MNNPENYIIAVMQKKLVEEGNINLEELVDMFCNGKDENFSKQFDLIDNKEELICCINNIFREAFMNMCWYYGEEDTKLPFKC